VLELNNKDVPKKQIALILKISKNSVKQIIKSGNEKTPAIKKKSKYIDLKDEIELLYFGCKGNLIRVHEELEDKGYKLSYQGLTAFCRRYKIGVKEKNRTGSYTCAPGQEMQHDTSPHIIQIGGKKRKIQCASLILCYSRMIFMQCFETYNRFLSKIFLTDALKYFNGSADNCILDNSTVILAYGTGANAVISAEMQSFENHFGFKFIAHELGDKNRSGKVERPFHFIENNFYPGRNFENLKDLNNQALKWCDKVNNRVKRELKATPLTLYQTERLYLNPLPLFIPEVYKIHYRIVTTDGYVNLHSNKYSVDTHLIGKRVEVRETRDKVLIIEKHNVSSEHDRMESVAGKRSMLPEHRFTGRWKKKDLNQPVIPEETIVRKGSPELDEMVNALKKRFKNKVAKHIRKLHKMYFDYPLDPLCNALKEALKYDLYDLSRIEKMVLKNIAGDFFQISIPERDSENE
jgi:transposase